MRYTSLAFASLAVVIALIIIELSPPSMPPVAKPNAQHQDIVNKIMANEGLE